MPVKKARSLQECLMASSAIRTALETVVTATMLTRCLSPSRAMMPPGTAVRSPAKNAALP